MNSNKYTNNRIYNKDICELIEVEYSFILPFHADL